MTLAIPPGPSASSSHDDSKSVQEIKDEVKANVQRNRGASAISLIHVARDRALAGFQLEREANLPGAFRALLTAANLTNALLETSEFKAESQSKNGVVWREFVAFQQVRWPMCRFFVTFALSLSNSHAVTRSSREQRNSRLSYWTLNRRSRSEPALRFPPQVFRHRQVAPLQTVSDHCKMLDFLCLQLKPKECLEIFPLPQRAR